MDHRKEELAKWAVGCLPDALPNGLASDQLLPVSGDASFRRYFRLNLPDLSYLLVDAPPDSEDCHSFVAMAAALRNAGLNAPEVLHVQYNLGFMLIEDFGDVLLLDVLVEQRNVPLEQTDNSGFAGDLPEQDFLEGDCNDEINRLYSLAMGELVKLQKNCDGRDLPPYTRKKLRDEMSLFTRWFCTDLLELSLDPSTCELIETTFSVLETAALSQPRVCVHKDYHSRNLMMIDGPPGGSPGLIDFQDAVYGPYTYDLVSLLRDCYIVWPAPQVRSWALEYLQLATQQGIVSEIEPDRFERDFDMMGLQRHLKVLGIFSRLYLRDKKARYLSDLPLVMNYLSGVSRNIPELADFSRWFEEFVMPVANKKLGVINK